MKSCIVEFLGQNKNGYTLELLTEWLSESTIIQFKKRKIKVQAACLKEILY